MEQRSTERHVLDLAQFGARLKEARQDRKLTQQELASLVQAPRTWVSDLENGGQRGLAAETVVRFALALGVSADYLLGLTDDARPRRRRRSGDDATERWPTGLALASA